MLTRYFGRAEEQGHLIEMLSGEDARLVTLIGPGGAGKTRLSLEVARQISPVFAGRVWWVSLADLPDARLLSPAITRALKVSETGMGDPMEIVLSRLNEAPCLLILDNFEHLLRDEPSGGAKGDQGLLDIATALVRLLLERAPNLRCLITSRRALRLSGEQEYPLSPLPVPTDSSLPEEVLASPSVALYADRARLALPDFRVTPNNAGAVARICRKLEGMPLAIEMAAAWAKVLPPAKMLERLEERLDGLTVLSGRRRDLPARHQSLRATIDWSYDLLDAPQKQLLARLSVFRGGWSLEAAEQVCASDDGDEPRYRLLETIRQYGRDRLDESGEVTRIRTRHFAHFRAMAEESWKTIRGPEPDKSRSPADRATTAYQRIALKGTVLMNTKQHAHAAAAPRPAKSPAGRKCVPAFILIEPGDTAGTIFCGDSLRDPNGQFGEFAFQVVGDVYFPDTKPPTLGIADRSQGLFVARHNGGMNLAYLDGHAKWTKLDRAAEKNSAGDRLRSFTPALD